MTINHEPTGTAIPHEPDGTAEWQQMREYMRRYLAS